MTLTLNYLFYLLGIVLVVVAGMIYVDKKHPRRLTTGTFWLVYALIFLIGDLLPANVVGVLVVAMALIAGFGGVMAGKPKMLSDEARRQSPLSRPSLQPARRPHWPAASHRSGKSARTRARTSRQ